MRSLLLALFAFAPAARASIYLVDDDGGPGVTFTTLSAAMSAVSSGDVLIVRPGRYDGFVVDRGVSVLGDAGAIVTGGILVTGVVADDRVTLSNLMTHWIAVEHCVGSVLLEELTLRPLDFVGASHAAGLDVLDCADVRARRVDVDQLPLGTNPGARVEAARLELTDSRLVGARGHDHDLLLHPGAAEPGGAGLFLVAASGAVAHVQNSHVAGGVGGSITSNPALLHTPGDGGPGVRAEIGSECLIVGPVSTVIVGGRPGSEVGFACNVGAPGNGIRADAGTTVRCSGQSVQGTFDTIFCGPPIVSNPTEGPVTFAVPADPWLGFGATPTPGALVSFTLSGAPGATAQLVFGRGPGVTPIVGCFEDQLTTPVRVFQLGALPPTGQKTVTLSLPGFYPRGMTIVAQGVTTSSNGAVARTPSASITLR